MEEWCNVSNKSMRMLRNKKEELLQKIDTIDAQRKKQFNDLLKKLQVMNQICAKSKESFTDIGSNADIAPKKRSEKLKLLLTMNVDNKDDDEKKTDNNYDHYKIIGTQCKYPGKAMLSYNKQSFNNTLNSCISIGCDDVTSSWKLKQFYNEDQKGNNDKPDKEILCFDVYETDYFEISNNGKTVQGKSRCAYSVVTTNTGFNKGIHVWGIKIIQSGHRYMNLGVITDITKLSSIQRASITQCGPCGYVYLWDNENTAIRGYHEGTQYIQDKTGITKLKANDIVIVTLNCDNWTISFARNDIDIGSLKLPRNQTYHPCVYACACTCQKCKLWTF